MAWNNANGQVTRQTSDLSNFRYFIRYQRAASATAGDGMSLVQNLETNQSIQLAGKAVTISVWARKGANFSPTSGQFVIYLFTGTGIDQNYASYTGQASTSGVFTPTTSWQRFSFTTTVPANATECAVIFSYVPSGTAGAADYMDYAGAQLEIGNVPTSFSTATGNPSNELMACQRYYERSYNLDMPSGTANTLGNGAIGNTGNSLAGSTAGNVGGFTILPFKVTKRVAPTMVTYDYDGTANAVRVYPGDAKRTGVTGLANVQTSGAYQFMSFNNTSATAIGSNNTIMFHWTADAEL